MANYYTHFSTALKLDSIEQANKAMELHHKLAHELEEADEGPIQFVCDIDEHLVHDKAAGGTRNSIGLWLHEEDGGSPTQVAAFVLQLGRELKLKGRWGFEYAETCGWPRIDAFGGGAVVVDFDKDEAHFLNRSAWLAEHGVK